MNYPVMWPARIFIDVRPSGQYVEAQVASEVWDLWLHMAVKAAAVRALWNGHGGPFRYSHENWRGLDGMVDADCIVHYQGGPLGGSRAVRIEALTPRGVSFIRQYGSDRLPPAVARLEV